MARVWVVLVVLVASVSCVRVNNESWPIQAPWSVWNDTQVAGSVLLNVPPRRMWGWGNGVDGYCGECSFQSVGLYWGNYISQEEVRYADGNAELLVAVNDEKAASALKFQYKTWNYNAKTPQETSFKAWLKSYLDNGVPVISGFYERQLKGKGDADYDHIMPIIGYTVDASGNMAGIYHNDLYLQETSLTAADFETRSSCTQSTAPVQPYDYCLPTDVDYGIAITGNVDPKNILLRAYLEVSMWDEPDWGAEDGLHQKPVMFDTTIHVSGLTVGTSYACLRFDDAKNLPATGDFLNAGWADRFDFVATAPQMAVKADPLLSDGTYFYRCVKV